MANDSYFGQLTRNFVLTSLLTSSALEAGCALHNGQKIEQNYVDIKTWRNGPESALVEYDGNVFFMWLMPSLQNEDPMKLVNRAVELMNEGGDPALKERIGNTELLRKGADLFSIINSDKHEFYASGLSGGSPETKHVKLKRVLNHDAWAPDVYYIVVPSPWNTIQQARDFYERQ